MRLENLSFHNLRAIAALGILPKRLPKDKIPKCVSCMHGLMTKKSLRHRGNNGKRKMIPENASRYCVSIDTMEPRTPGFTAQLKGLPTKRHYKCATKFKDDYSDLICAHLRQSNDGESVIEVKKAVKCYARNPDVDVKHCHVDNGRFADKAFIAHVESKNQTISYFSSCAHHQNGRAENL